MILRTRVQKRFFKSILPLVWLVSFLFVFQSSAWAVEEKSFQEKSIYGPIQSRLYDLDHELALGWAYLPLDPYYKGYGFQLSYTIHFNHFLALELFRLGWSYNVDSALKTKLIEQIPSVTPEKFPAVVFFENTNLLFKILYGKQSLVNRLVLHFDVFLTLGGSFFFRNPYPIWQGDLTYSDYCLGVNGGVGFRFWFNPRWSIRVDIRDTVILLVIKGEKGSEDQAQFVTEHSALIGITFAVNL